MKIRTLWFGASTLLLLGAALAAPAVAQTMYDDEKRPIYIDREKQQRDVYDATRRDVQTRDVITREAREAAQRASVPSRAYTMDVAQVDRAYDRSFRQTVNSRKLGATDWQELRRQRSEIDELKDRIRAGHQVTPSQVDRALGYYNQSRPGY